MRKLFALVAVTVVAVGVRGAGPESGPQVGDRLPGPFDPLHLNGPDADEESCLFCKYGNDPVVMVFARSQSDGLTKLLKAAEAAAVKHESAGLGAAVVYLDTSAALKA